MHALVVEDDVSIRVFLTSCLEQMGYDVFDAANGLEALAALTYSGRFDLVVSDLRMPALDGVQVIQWIRKEHPELPIMIASAYLELKGMVDALPDDVTTLQKPFSKQQFVEAVNHALRDSHHK